MQQDYNETIVKNAKKERKRETYSPEMGSNQPKLLGDEVIIPYQCSGKLQIQYIE